jgi:hypothetical protein
MSDNGKVFDLRTLKNRVAGTMRVDDDHTHDVLKLNGEQYKLLKESDSSNSVERIYTIVGEIVPTLSAGAVMKLTLDEAQAILTYAGQGIAAVEALYPPNSSSPEKGASISLG